MNMSLEEYQNAHLLQVKFFPFVVVNKKPKKYWYQATLPFKWSSFAVFCVCATNPPLQVAFLRFVFLYQKQAIL